MIIPWKEKETWLSLVFQKLNISYRDITKGEGNGRRKENNYWNFTERWKHCNMLGFEFYRVTLSNFNFQELTFEVNRNSCKLSSYYKHQGTSI